MTEIKYNKEKIIWQDQQDVEEYVWNQLMIVFSRWIFDREEVIMTLDEYETIRLIDLEEYTQHECAKQMNISRTTTAEIYKSARYKMADSVVNGKKHSDHRRKLSVFANGTTCPFL